MIGDLPLFEEVPLALLAGGLGARAGSAAAKLPKALIEVAGHPFIFHQLALVRRKGIRRVVICIGFLGDQIESAVGDGASFDLEIKYSSERELLGTAGALKNAERHLGDLFWVMYGDTYLDIDFQKVFEAFGRSRSLGIMTIFLNANRFDRSNIVFRDGRLIEYNKRVQRPDMLHIEYGLSLLRSAVLQVVPEGRQVDLTDLYNLLVARGALDAVEVQKRFYEIGSPAGLAETRAFLAEQSD